MSALWLGEVIVSSQQSHAAIHLFRGREEPISGVVQNVACSPYAEPERVVLRRISIFVGFFTLAAAAQVASGETVNEDELVAAVASLASKYLIAVERKGCQRQQAT
jgi:hypothetical protein